MLTACDSPLAPDTESPALLGVVAGTVWWPVVEVAGLSLDGTAVTDATPEGFRPAHVIASRSAGVVDAESDQVTAPPVSVGLCGCGGSTVTVAASVARS